MRKISSAATAVILAIALYFTLFWGYDALRILTSPTYGLEDVWRSQYVFGIGSVFGLAPVGLLQLAAFFGTLKLAVAVVCAIHLVDRLRSLAGGTASSEILEGGLILVVLITIASAGPADLVAQYRAGARSGDPACAGRSRHRALHGRTQLSPR